MSPGGRDLVGCPSGSVDNMLALAILLVLMILAAVVALEVPEEELKTRIKERAKTSGRVDDQDEDKINNRIKVYLEETSPVAGFYKEQGKLTSIDGVGSIDHIFSEICNTVDQY